MSAVDDAVALQSILTDLSHRSIADTAELFRRYSDQPEFLQILQTAFPELVGPYLEASALISAQHYDELAPNLAYTATPIPEIPQDRIDNTIRWSLYAPGNSTSLDRLSGALQRMVFDASRHTILTNLAAEYDVPMTEIAAPGTRWARHASANACSFCRMLATRGAVYRSKNDTVRVSGRSIDLTIADKRRLFQGQGFITTSQLNQAAVDEALARRSNYSNRRAASKQGKLVGDAKTRHLRGEQKLGDKYHDGCHCVAVAVRLGESYEPPDYVGQWEQDYSAAVRATQAEGKTKGEYGAIDVTAVLNHMDRASRN